MALITAIYLVGGLVNLDTGHSYHLGFGQTDLLPIGFETYGYVYVAQFLQQVAPHYALQLRLDAYGAKEDVTSSAYVGSYSNDPGAT